VAASYHGDTPYSGNSVTPVPVTSYTTSVNVNRRGFERLLTLSEPTPFKAVVCVAGLRARWQGSTGRAAAKREWLRDSHATVTASLDDPVYESRSCTPAGLRLHRRLGLVPPPATPEAQ
jgi:hypothetical protein